MYLVARMLHWKALEDWAASNHSPIVQSQQLKPALALCQSNCLRPLLYHSVNRSFLHPLVYLLTFWLADSCIHAFLQSFLLSFLPCVVSLVFVVMYLMTFFFSNFNFSEFTLHSDWCRRKEAQCSCRQCWLSFPPPSGLLTHSLAIRPVQ